MSDDFQVKKGCPYPLGVTAHKDGINISMVTSDQEEAGILLIRRDGSGNIRIPFAHEFRCGNISAIFLRNLDVAQYDYNFFRGNRICPDPYAGHIIGNEVWGEPVDEKDLRCAFACEIFDWEADETLRIPYENSLIYCLHVRGFTKHESSKVKHKGTFEGILEKLGYLKSLSITAVELMPCYEFLEADKTDITEDGSSSGSMEYAMTHYSNVPKEKEVKLNYWGYRKAFYFAPKASYCSQENPEQSFRQFVKKMHENGLEVILQFYFPDEMKQGYILDVLKHWVTEYHIDGFHLKGNRVPVTLIATEPLFANTKILYDCFNESEIYGYREIPTYKNLAVYRDDFQNCMRKFLKGDGDIITGVLSEITGCQEKTGSVHFMANYNSFTIRDMVTYERKHNEENGEDNRDGSDYNLSWNCGTEGPTGKRSITSLRKQQIMNALILLLLSKGTPLLFEGDEFGRTGKGNNNPYCQDNDISWVNWNLNKEAKEILQFTRSLALFRKEHQILHSGKELSMLDRYSCGYPELSFHSEEPWRVNPERERHYVGILYSDCSTDNSRFLYIAYNMHWEDHLFSLPQLPDRLIWKRVLDSAFCPDEESVKKTIAKRSIVVFEAVEDRSNSLLRKEEPMER